MTRIRTFFLLAAALLAAPAVHGEPSVSARLSASETYIGGSVQLAVEIAGASEIASEPTFEASDFQVQRAGQTRSFQWVNGKSASMISFNYLLAPTRTGALRIPAISVTADGKTFTTEALTVNVRGDAPGAAAAAEPAAPQGRRSVDVPAEGLRPLFMTASVDSDKAYVGQQVLLKVQFLRRPDIQLTSQARYSEPELTGFLVEPLKQQKYMTSINGAQYEVTELSYALFPTSDGQFAVGGAQIEVAVRAGVNSIDPNSFFDNFFTRSQVARLATRAIPVSVRALPKNKPENFSGAVGRYKVTAALDAAELEAGKPVSLILSVTGVGNIKALKEPFLPEAKGFRRYETLSTSKADVDGRFLHGSKEFKILLIPQVSGTLVVPSARFVYFDPAQNDYVVETTPEIPVTVKPGNIAAGGSPEQTATVPAGSAAEGIRVIERDIRFIKTGEIKPVSRPLYAREWFLLLNALPPLFAITAFLVRRGRARRSEHADEYRSKSAARNARRRLAAAKKEMSSADPSAFYGPVQVALSGYIADKVGVGAAGLTRDMIERLLGEKHVEPETRLSVHDLLDKADAARFAASSFEDDDRSGALARAEAAIRSMEKTL